MATYTLTIKNAIASELVDAFTDIYDYQETLYNGLNPVPNPETRAAFTKRKIAEHPKKILQAYRAKVASQATAPVPVAETDLTIS